MTVLGTLDACATGEIANYVISGEMVKEMGGPMDLVLNPAATKVPAIPSHMDIHWGPKMKDKYDLPLAGKACVHTIITESVYFDVKEGGLVLEDYNPESSVEETRGKTGARFEVGRDCRPLKLPDM